MLFHKLAETIELLSPDSVTLERRTVLKPLIDFIQGKVDRQEEIRINFICTHNSRRSHLSQIWAQTMAHYFDVNPVFCYSGGTESTALFPVVAETLEQSGFEIQKLSMTDNPIYSIKYASNSHPIIGFSKKLDDNFNPTSDFAAVMTCSQADGGCPFIAGAVTRIPITYKDPKIFDTTSQQMEKYQERSLQIATEMKYIFSQITVK
jgi:arsenate reductase